MLAAIIVIIAIFSLILWGYQKPKKNSNVSTKDVEDFNNEEEEEDPHPGDIH